MKTNRIILIILTILGAAILACSTTTPQAAPTNPQLPTVLPPTNTPEPTTPPVTDTPPPTFTPTITATSTRSPTPTNSPTVTLTPLPSASPTPFVGGTCDPDTIRIEMNTNTEQHVSSGNYPDCCNVYCLWVPDNGDRLEIGITDFNVDLDIYVDTDLSVLAFGDHGRWESNAYGTGDEMVTIYDPGGRYYIQVCSYEGLASYFMLFNEYTP